MELQVLGGGIAYIGCSHGKEQYVLGDESELLLVEIAQCTAKQACTYNQQHRECYLNDYQPASGEAFAPPGCGSGCVLEPGVHRCPRGLPCRRDAEEHACQHGYCSREDDDYWIKVRS